MIIHRTTLCPTCRHPISDHDRQYGCNHDQCECEYHPAKIAPKDAPTITLRQIATEIPLGFECRQCGKSAYNWISKIDRYIQDGEGCCPDFRSWIRKAKEKSAAPTPAISSNHETKDQSNG